MGVLTLFPISLLSYVVHEAMALPVLHPDALTVLDPHLPLNGVWRFRLQCPSALAKPEALLHGALHALL